MRTAAKVLDDAAALFARHLYFALVEGHTVRQAFDYATAQLASAAPSLGLPNPTAEASKFILLPHWDAEQEAPPTGAASDDGVNLSDPHDEPIFPWLPPGAVVERNPLPELEPPYVQKPFLGCAIALHQLVLKLAYRRQKEVRLVTLCGPAGVGKSSLARAAASHLFERRWFPEGCVRVELGGCASEGEALAALTEALDMEFASMGDIGAALKHWRGLLVLDECDAARVSGLMLTILYKLLSTQEVRVLCTSRSAIGAAGRTSSLRTEPLAKRDAARLFRELASEALPPALRKEATLMNHPVLELLHCLPRAIWQTAPLLRQGKSMAVLELTCAVLLTTRPTTRVSRRPASRASTRSGRRRHPPRRSPR